MCSVGKQIDFLLYRPDICKLLGSICLFRSCQFTNNFQREENNFFKFILPKPNKSTTNVSIDCGK
jgi:hypothetical protein